MISKPKHLTSKLPRLTLSYWIPALGWMLLIGAYAIGHFVTLQDLGGTWRVLDVFVMLLIAIIPPVMMAVIFKLTQMGHTKKTAEIQIMPTQSYTGNLDIPLHETVTQIHQRLNQIEPRLSELAASQSETTSALHKLFKRQHAAGTIGAVHLPALQNFDAPSFHVVDRTQGGRLPTLKDVSDALNFSDHEQRGQWANAYARIQETGLFLNLIREAEAVIDGLEAEGLYVEDIALRQPSELSWRDLARGQRNAETQDLETIKDRTILAIVRARLRNDKLFQEHALLFQKHFIAMLEILAPHALTEEFDALTDSRGGRAFCLLGTLSGVFQEYPHETSTKARM